ncbi:MAG: hypothetical protein EP319_12015 [Deltaproteobacteria bacterium]|nr:MAG: hypothetical protein EP319_12015 [Deltaproteobacteria bacterium]
MRVLFMGQNAINSPIKRRYIMKLLLVYFFLVKATYADTLDRLYSYLNGSFTSGNQSIYNSKFFDVTVRHCPVNIINGNIGSKYLFLRQAISLFQESPYRTRLVELSLSGDVITSNNYEPIVDIDLSNTCTEGETPSFERNLFSKDPKCTVYLYEDESLDIFVGSTGVPGCKSEMNGASYVSSDVEISRGFFKSLDRGWDSNNNQVWGSIDGPYLFERLDFSDLYPNLVELSKMLVGETSNQKQYTDDSENFQYVRSKTCPIKIKNNSYDKSISLITNQVIYSRGRAISRSSLYRVKPIDPKQTYSNPLIESHPISDSDFFDYCSHPQRWNDEYELSLDANPCTIHFSKGISNGKPVYLGNTPQAGCSSNFRDSVRLDINEEISNEIISVWERWYDSSGSQTAGSKAGPYIYRKENKFNAEYIPLR